jgi:hypothetical protein
MRTTLVDLSHAFEHGQVTARNPFLTAAAVAWLVGRLAPDAARGARVRPGRPARPAFEPARTSR